MTRPTPLFVAILAVILWASPAPAGDARRPSTDDLVERLKPQDFVTRNFLSTKGVSVEGGPIPPAGPPSVDLEVTFPFNSASLTTDAMLTLDQLGKALANPILVGSRFQVAGHTDGVGSNAFNQTLSEKRAAAAKDYLITRHGIASARLEAVGFGEARLLDPAHPEAGINRRVQVTNLGERALQTP